MMLVAKCNLAEETIRQPHPLARIEGGITMPKDERLLIKEEIQVGWVDAKFVNSPDGVVCNEIYNLRKILKAQDAKTAKIVRAEERREIGEWLESKFVAIPLIGGEWHIRPDEVEALKQGMNKKLTKEQMRLLDELLPSAELFSSALSYEIGLATGKGLFKNYPDNYNEGMEEVSKRLRDWLVNPPKGKYSWEA